MKVSKKDITIFTFSIVIGLLLGTTIVNAIGVDTTPMPVNSLQWDITSLETIDGTDYYLNETVSIETGGELRILNSNFYVNADLLRIDVQQGGALYVENSNITVTDSSYTYTITSVSNVGLPTIGSNYTFIDSYLVNAKFSISQYGVKFCDFISTRTTFENFEQFRLQKMWDVDFQESTFFNSSVGVQIVEGHNVVVQHNTFQLVAYGINIESSTTGTVGYNNFLDIVETGLEVDDFSRIVVAGSQLIYEWNVFDNITTGAILSDSRVHFLNNDLKNLQIGLTLDNSDYGNYEYNNFTNIVENCIEATGTRATYIQKNNFIDSDTGLSLEVSPVSVIDNYFNNLTSGVVAYDSDGMSISDNNFTGITYYAIETDETREVDVVMNTITNSLGGIIITHGRICLIQENVLNTVEDGIAIIYSRDISVLGNTVNNTISGYYIETTTEIILTANGAINAQYGISLWSVTEATLASNGVFDSVYGLSIWFSENIEMSGNDVSTSNIGIVGRNTFGITVRDGQYTELTRGIQLIGCRQARIYGNTFDEITEDAITLSSSSGFVVYNNNFLTVGNYGSIDNSFGTFYKQLTNVTYVGNYYEAETGLDPVLIDVFTVDLVTYNITDYYPLASKYNVKPSVEYFTRDIQEPTDIDAVTVTTQVFIPEDTENVVVYLQYNLINETEWRLMDITSTETPIGSIGAISQFYGIIEPLPYAYQVTYRIMVNYTIDLVGQSLFSENATYSIGESEETPIVIGVPEVRVVTYSQSSERDITVVTNTFYQDTEYFVFVSVKNKTDIQIIAGKRHVNLSWYEIDPQTNETQFFSGVMDYNSSLSPMAYYASFGRGYPEGMIIKYYISVVDSNGTFYRSVLNYTMIFQPPIQESGFDTITLLSLGGTLLLVQVIVVYRRRKKTKEE